MTLIGPGQISSRFSSEKKRLEFISDYLHGPDLLGAGEQLVKFGMVADRFPHRIDFQALRGTAPPWATEAGLAKAAEAFGEFAGFIPGGLCFNAFVPSENTEQRCRHHVH